MSNYIKTTNFAAKDSLPSGNPAKIVKGTEINTEFDNIAVASATKLNSSAVSTFGGTLIDDANASAARTTLGLGTAATTASTDYATAAQGTTADAALPRTGGAMTGAITTNSTFDGRDVATDGTKLDGIEAGADVTDTTNVVASLSAGTGISLSAGGEIANTAPDQTVALTGAGGTSVSGTYPSFTITSTSFALPVATDTTLGGIELFSDTDQTVVANAVTTTAARTYGIQLNSDDQAVVNVPWTDTTYTVGDGGLTEINFTSADNTKLDGIEASADVTDTANVTAAGALMTTGGTLTGDLNFGDNDKATFGAGDDLQIYHDGQDSYIKDAGTGRLKIIGNDQVRLENTDGDAYLAAVADGSTFLYHAGSNKFSTTSTGIDVTGTATMDGLSVDNGTQSVSSTGNNLQFNRDGGSSYIEQAGTGSIALRTDAKTRSLFASNGDISFYEDTGTTPKLFWDASATSLGIGTSSPANNLQVVDGTEASFRIDKTGTGASAIQITAGNNTASINSTKGATDLTIGTANTERLRIDSSGNLLVGKTSATATDLGCQIESDGQIKTTSNSQSALTLNRKTNDGSIALFQKDGTTVGSIGIEAAGFTIDGETGHTGLQFGSSAIIPRDNGSNTDGANDLGASVHRFKDLHLSGTANVGSIAVTGAITEDAETLTGTATTIDLATATNFTHTLTGATTYTFSNPATTGNATAFTLKVIQDITARTITWPASVDWAGGTAPTLTATSGGVDVFVFYTIDGGTTYYGFTAGQAMA